MISVCIPALNEAATIGDICREISSHLMPPKNSLVSDLVLIDGGSTDGTPRIAEAAGARVVPQKMREAGKGGALYESVLAVDTEIIVWCDGDLTSFTKDCIVRLAEPLLNDSSLMMVKGCYMNRQLGGEKTGGGRTSWLMARPAISLFFPMLAHIREPLSGEYSIRRTAAKQVRFIKGYGVELGLLIDIARIFGVSAISEVNLGSRSHKNKPLEDLSIQAAEILHTALYKAGVDFKDEWSKQLIRPISETLDLESTEIQIGECPPF